MKIEIKFTADQVFATAKLLEQVYHAYPTQEATQKVHRSIAFDIADKFTTKQRKLYQSKHLFDDKKKHQITLKYHEANTLHTCIQYFLPFIPKAQKAHNDLLQISNTLHQKLV